MKGAHLSTAHFLLALSTPKHSDYLPPKETFWILVDTVVFTQAVRCCIPCANGHHGKFHKKKHQWHCESQLPCGMLHTINRLSLPLWYTAAVVNPFAQGLCCVP